MVALIVSLLVEQVKSGLPNKNVLTTEFSVTILVLILFSFLQKGLSLSCKICSMKKEMSYWFYIVSTTIQRVYRI